MDPCSGAMGNHGGMLTIEPLTCGESGFDDEPGSSKLFVWDARRATNPVHTVANPLHGAITGKPCDALG